MNRLLLFFATVLLILVGMPQLMAQKTGSSSGNISLGTSKPNDNKDEEDKDTERQGPANLPFEILNQVASDYEFESNNGILNIFRKVYRDANAQSGYYYYLPAEYNLNWTEETGQYALYINYKSADASGRGEAVVTAELKPNIGRNDLDIARQLLELDIQNNEIESKHGVKQLVSMPLAAPPSISFSQLRNYGVDPEDIVVRTPTDFLDPIVISWSMERVDDLMGALFNNIGLNGNLTLQPDGEGMPAIEIPINLKIDDAKTFGKLELDPLRWRRDGWHNQTDYPLVLKNFHVMRLKKEGSTSKPYIYTWEMGNIEVPEKAKVKFDAGLVPTWLDGDKEVHKVWMEYTVNPCVSCNQTVKGKILGGTSASQVNRIEITTLSPLEFTEAEMMRIRIRSYQADPNGTSKITLPTITIREDFQTISGGELFIDEGQTPEFEFFIQLYMSDGTKYEASEWKKSDDLEIVIGKKQIQELIPAFK